MKICNETLSQPISLWDKGRQAVQHAVWLYLKYPGVSLIDLGWRLYPGERVPDNSEVHVRIHRLATPGENTNSNNLTTILDTPSFKSYGFPVFIMNADYVLNQRLGLRRHPVIQIDPTSLVEPISLARQFTGTLAGWVQDIDNGDLLLLSSWHVLSGSHEVGCEVEVPNSLNGESGVMQKINIRMLRHALADNLDAAVARGNWPEDFRPEPDVQGIGTEILVPQLGMRLTKEGNGSGSTTGIVTGILGYTIQNDGGRKWVIGPTIHICAESPQRTICAPGDSGALWVEQSTGRPVALHFAGSQDGQFALALPLPEILHALGVRWVGKFSKPTTPPKQEPKISTPQPELAFSNHASSPIAGVAVGMCPTASANTASLCRLACRQVRLTIKEFPKWLMNLFQVKKIKMALSNGASLYWINFGIAGAFVIFLLLMLKANVHRQVVEQRQQLCQASIELMQITNIAQIEQQRQYTLQKIIAIINLYNPGMDDKLKRQIAEEIYAMTLKYSNLDLELICATITHETGLTWDPKIISPANAIGLMQILPGTGIVLAREEGLQVDSITLLLSDPIVNIRLGCRYLSQLIAAYHLDGGLAAYNGGMKRAELWLRNGRGKGILHQETDRYIPSILKIYQQYQKM